MVQPTEGFDEFGEPIARATPAQPAGPGWDTRDPFLASVFTAALTGLLAASRPDDWFSEGFSETAARRAHRQVVATAKLLNLRAAVQANPENQAPGLSPSPT